MAGALGEDSMRRPWLPCTLGLFTFVLGCGGDDPAPLPSEACPVDVRGAELRFDPAASFEVELWPDPALQVDDAASPSGVRLEPAADRALWIEKISPILVDVVQEQMRAAGGFGRNGGAVFRFTGPIDGLPDSVEASLDSDAARWLDLSSDPPTPVPFAVEQSPDGAIVLLQPAVTLDPATEYLVTIGASVQSAGGCVATSPAMGARLGDATTGDALARAGLAPSQVVAATTFTTHADEDVVITAAGDAQGRSFAWATAPTCQDATGFRECDGTFEAQDYRGADLEVGPSPQGTYEVPVTIYLPATPGPHPVLVFGHGLSGTRTSFGSLVTDFVQELGVAVVATDALRHGDHPTRSAETAADTAVDFLGLDLEGEIPIDTRALTSNFNQTVLDRVQLVELIKANADVDGDGTPDLDVQRMGYWGISLGGLLGPGLLALSDDLQIGVLTVGGGKLTDVIRDGSALGGLLGALEGLFGGPGEFAAMLAVVQSVLDRGDPASWGTRVLRDRPGGGVGPHLLLPVANEDEVVPPSSGRALARALELPHMQPVATAVAPLVPVTGPLAGNLDGVTAGFFQFDRIEDPPVPATHIAALSDEMMEQARHFVRTWLDDGTPEIVDPYPVVGTPPL